MVVVFYYLFYTCNSFIPSSCEDEKVLADTTARIIDSTAIRYEEVELLPRDSVEKSLIKTLRKHKERK